MSDIYLSDLREPYRTEYEVEIRKKRPDLRKLLDENKKTDTRVEIKIAESLPVEEYEEY